MKPSASALFSAIVIGGGWVSLPAFASDVRPAVTVSRETDGGVATRATHDAAATCRAEAHAHSSTCTCARCAAVQAE